MKDSKNMTIAVLCVSACILVTALILGHISTKPALAETSVRGGNYIMCTGALGKATELIYVIDISKQKLNIYAADVQHNNLVPIDQVNLKVAFKAR